MNAFENTIRKAQRRAFIDAAIRRGGYGVLYGTGVSLALLIADRLLNWTLPPELFMAPPALGLFVGIVAALHGRLDRLAAAVHLDRALRLKDQFGSAEALLLGETDRRAHHDEAFAALVRVEADRLAAKIDLRNAAPIRVTGVWGSTVAAIFALWLGVVLLPSRVAEAIVTDAAGEVIDPEEVARERQELVETIEESVSELREEQGLDARTLEDLQALEALADQLESGEAQDADLSQLRDESAARLGEVADRMAEQAQRELEAQQEVARRFAGLKKPELPMTADEFSEALQRGDFDRAADLLDDIQANRDQYSDAERQEMADHLRALGERLDEAGQLDARSDEARDEAIKQALRDQGLDDASIEELLNDPPPSDELSSALRDQGVDDEIADDIARDVDRDEQRREFDEQVREDSDRVSDALRDAADQIEQPEDAADPRAGDSPTPDPNPATEESADQPPASTPPDGGPDTPPGTNPTAPPDSTSPPRDETDPAQTPPDAATAGEQANQENKDQTAPPEGDATQSPPDPETSPPQGEQPTQQPGAKPGEAPATPPEGQPQQQPSGEQPGTSPQGEQQQQQVEKPGAAPEGGQQPQQQGEKPGASPEGASKQPQPGEQTGTPPEDAPTQEQPGEQPGAAPGDPRPEGQPGDPTATPPAGEQGQMEEQPGASPPGEQPQPGASPEGEQQRPDGGASPDGEQPPEQPGEQPGAAPQEGQQPQPGEEQSQSPGEQSAPQETPQLDEQGMKRMEELIKRMPSSVLREFAERAKQAEKNREVSDEMREQAKRLLEQLTDEQREALQDVADTMQPPSQGGQAPPPGDDGESGSPEGDPSGSSSRLDPGRLPAPLQFDGTEDIDIRGTADADKIIAEWLSDEPLEGEAGRTDQPGRAQRLRQARDVAERAVDDSVVPPRYHNLIKRYFGNLDKTIDKASAPAADAPVAKPGATDPPARAPGQGRLGRRMTVTFDQPLFLLLGLLALPLLVIGWRSTVGMDRARRVMAMSLRTILLLCLCVILTGPRMLQSHDHLTVIGLLDVSGSVKRFAELPETPDITSRSSIEYLRQWFRQATESKAPDDRFGLIVFDGTAIAIAAPTTTEYVDDNLDITLYEGTNIAEAVRLGLAMFPADTARRLVLVSDGNETSGDVVEAARQAAGGVEVELASVGRDRISVPIDVLPLTYRVTGDVQVVRVEAPPSAEPGQRITVRVILEATRPTAGSLSLFRERVPVDINGAAPGGVRRVNLPEGQSVHLAQVTLGSTPINRFQAMFEADEPGDDLLADNNVAEAFTATPSRGTVLVLDRRAPDEPNFLAELFRQAGLPAEALSPLLFPQDLLSLQAYDLIVLDNVAASELSTQQHDLISHFVSDLGGGLIMVGGEDSFGAGGWNGTKVEEVLPLELDPPKELRLPTAALVLVLDRSGSMTNPVAGTRKSQQFVANEAAALAVESLRTDSLVGVIGFNMSPHVVVPLRRNDDPRAIAKAIRGITPDGGTNLADALLEAQHMLEGVDVARKRIVCLSDGQSLEGDFQNIAQGIADRNIKVTTIAVGDDADMATMQLIAEVGGGEFYPVRNPRVLPRVLVDSVQSINKPLIKDVPFIPTVLPTGASLTLGLGEGPPLGGLVITAPKPDNKVVLEMVNDDSEPLLAHWQVGLGRVAAFTSDAQGKWSDLWLQWEPASTFWTQLARLISRPAVSQDAELVTTIDGDRLQVALEIANEGEGFFDYLQVEGRVYRPDGESRPIRLRQTAPGRYEGSTDALQAGNYIVALNPRQGSKQLSPVIGGVSRATSPEFRSYVSNAAVLDRVASLTGGRTLALDQPAALDLFDRTGMPPSISNLPAWRFLVFAALALLLLDVATRRLAWNMEMIRAGLSAAVAKVRPGHVRARKATATLSSLRRVSESFDDRLDSESEGLQKLKGTGVIAPPPNRIEPLHAEEPPAREPKRVAAAFDTLLGRRRAKPEPEPDETPEAGAAQGDKAEPTKATASTSTAADESDDDDSGIGSNETTSGLLAAKRRMRRDLDR